MADSSPSIEVSCQEARQELEQGEDVLLLDCRESTEHAIGHVSQAMLLPMSELQARVSELEPYREREVLVMCHHGMRSLRVANWLREQGFSQARSISGGIDAWSVEIDPSVPRY